MEICKLNKKHAGGQAADVREKFLLNKPKKHHYVPQFILSKFCIGKTKKVYVFDKKYSSIFASHIRNTAHENNFYQDDDLGFNTSTESKLAEIEGICAPIIDEIVTEESITNLTKYEHAMICLFIAIQLARTNKTREFLASFNKSISEWIRQSGADPNKDVENFKELSKDEVKNASITVLRSVPGDLAKHILNKEIVLLKSPKGDFFYISDNPITMHNYFPRPGRGNLGLSLKGIEIHFPITPRLCLSFMCSDMIQDIRAKVKNFQFRTYRSKVLPVDMPEHDTIIEDIDNKEVSYLKPENVEFHNSLQVIQASRFVFSKNKKFELAQDMLKTNPELSEPQELMSNVD